MVTATQVQSTSRLPSRKPKLAKDTLGFDFAVLGLKARESRVGVIRRAAADLAQRINAETTGSDEHGTMLSQVATSTYRLLDPRRRNRTHERVQLCLFSEEDLDRQKQARRPLFLDEGLLPKCQLIDVELVERPH